MKNTNCGQPERGSRNQLFAIGRLSTPARGDVTDIACPGGILLVEQQVSLSLLIRDRNRHTSDFPRRTKQIRRRLTNDTKLVFSADYKMAEVYYKSDIAKFLESIGKKVDPSDREPKYRK